MTLPNAAAAMTPTARFSFLRHWRWGLAALAALLLIVAVGRWAENREFQLKAATLRQAAAAHALGLRGIVEKHDYLPYVAARHPDVLGLLLHPADAALPDRVNRYLADLQQRTGAAALFVVDAQGQTLAASNWGTPTSFVGQSYRQRPYFEDALQGRRGLFYGLGLTTGQPGLFIAEPVRSGAAIVGVAVVKLGLERLEQTWSRSVDPVVLQDSRGIVFLSSVPEWLYHSDRPLERADLDWLRQHGQYGARERYERLPWQLERNGDGDGFTLQASLQNRRKDYLAVQTTLPELGWTLTVTSDLVEVRQARQEALVIATLAAALLLLGVLYWRLREKRYAEQRQARLELERRVQERTHDLQEAHAFRKAMEDSLLIGMRARDPQGRIIYVNPALCEMVGYSQEELLGCMPPYPYWHPDDLDKHMRESDDALQGRAAPHGFESRIRHRDGHDVITMVYTAPLIDAEGEHQGWMSSVVDITAQKQAEARQREQERQLQRSARLASVGEMASTLAHELNQPLMALSNFAVAARAMIGHCPQDMLVTALDEIVEQATRASEIVKRVRAFINPQRGSYEGLAIDGVIAHSLALLQPELQRGHVAVRSVLADGLPPVRGDRVLLEQVLVNLVQNAVQAMHDTPPARRRIELTARQAGPAVEVTVADNGPGIPAEQLEQVFSAFFSTKSDGLGLGLNICRTIVEAHGGHLAVANRPGGGAAFTFTLPTNP
ncbi:ATP-binding protein [Zoogloea sp.]|uniref:sensor histidine kinase n=1 Tax=Zoogloea sp. TaxID=49181 RepID=UPI0035B03B66